jgi:hypothetical protein
VIFFVCSHPDRIPIDLVIDENSHEDCYISPSAIPDVDVNDLYYFYDIGKNQYRMDRWAFDFAQEYLAFDIVGRLKRKEMICFLHPEAEIERI